MRARLFLLILLIPVILTLPLRAQQKIVAPTLRSAQKRATGILPVKGHGQDGHGTSMSADLKVSATTPISTAAKPFSSLVTVAFSLDDEPTVNSQGELAVATSGSHNLRRRSNG